MNPRVARGKLWLKWGFGAVAVLLASKWFVMVSGGATSKDVFLALITQGLAASLLIPLPAFALGWVTAPKVTPADSHVVASDAQFTQVAKELVAGMRDEGLWVKAFALENGDDSKAKAHYIRLRIEKLQRDTGGAFELDNVHNTVNKRAVLYIFGGVVLVALSLYGWMTSSNVKPTVESSGKSKAEGENQEYQAPSSNKLVAIPESLESDQMAKSGIGGNQSEGDIHAWGKQQLTSYLPDSRYYELAIQGAKQWQLLYISKLEEHPDDALFHGYRFVINVVASKGQICHPDATKDGGMTVMPPWSDTQVTLHSTCWKIPGR